MNILPSAVLAGHVVASVARNLVSTALVVAVACLLGFSPSASPAQWLAAFREHRWDLEDEAQDLILDQQEDAQGWIWFS